MKEKDFDKSIDNIIIDGLRKEAAQDNADFEAAVRNMSDEAFQELIQRRPRHLRPKSKSLLPWIVSAITSVAVVLIVLIPSINAMEGRLCDTALFASAAYADESRGTEDIINMTVDEVKAKLPELEKQYEQSLKKASTVGDYDIPNRRPRRRTKTNVYVTQRQAIEELHKVELQDAGWNLTMAYLKLHRKDDAVRVLTHLADRFSTTEYGRHCSELLRQLN